MNNLIIVLLGKKNSGKSYFAKTHLIKCFNRIVVFDTQNEYNRSNDLAKFLRDRFIFFETLEDFESGYIDDRIWDRDEFIVIIKTGDRDIIFECLRLIYEYGYTTILFEEAHLLDSQKKDILYDIITTGRHKYLNFIITSQRAQRLSTDLLSQADIIFSFKQSRPGDINYLKDYTEDPERLKRLNQGEYIILDGSDTFKELMGLKKKT